MLSAAAERAAIVVAGLVIVVVFGAAVAGAVHLSAQEPAAALTSGPGSGLREADFDGTLHTDLESALAAAGVAIPIGGNVYAAIVRPAARGLRFEEYEAGGGAAADNFWPASSVKTMAAVGALEFLHERGFTGSATATFADNVIWNVRDLYRAAIVDSDNEAYDRLVELAGIEWLNTEFLTPANRFPQTVVQKSYVDLGPVPSSEVIVREGDRVLVLPPRPALSDHGVPDDGNRSNLREMTEAISRVVLNDALPSGLRYDIHPSDLLTLRVALLAAEGFVAPGAQATLGRGSLVYDKPGYVVGVDCVDVAFIQSPDRRRSFLFGVSVPDDGASCATLAEIAQETLEFLNLRA